MNSVYCMSEEKTSPTCRIKENHNDTQEHKIHNYRWVSNIILEWCTWGLFHQEKFTLNSASIPPPPKN